ncbi:MAG: ribbon-helix-helix protein, CopG family [Bifidobacteriaceae bacterium]|jgi:hypothetical protein|nr:ribbon-helix-helix protein, CopG family [Bifidobacteriaceae bacterium]
MAALERRAQILFTSDQYAELERLARRNGQSVGSIIREAVDERLARPRSAKLAALDRLLASTAGRSEEDPGDWETIKAGFERSYLDGIG